MGSLAMGLFFENKPPETSGTYQVMVEAVDDAAENFDWVTELGSDAPKGTVWLTLEALEQDIYVRFKSTSAAAGTTASNGRLVKAGSPGVSWYCSPSRHRYIDAIAAAAGATLKVQVSSNIGNRTDQ